MVKSGQILKLLKLLCDVSPWTAGGHTQRLLAGLSHAAHGQDDSHQDQGHSGGQHHVQPDVEVRTLGQPTNLKRLILLWRLFVLA